MLDRDNRGRIISRSEPNVDAATLFMYDAYNRVTRVANGAKWQQMQYDVADRLIQRTTSDGGTATWTFDNAANGLGLLASATTSAGYMRSLVYDALGRVRNESVTVRGRTFTSGIEYDGVGRVSGVQFPSGYRVRRHSVQR